MREERGLVKTLGLFEAVTIGIGGMIGGAIFVSIGVAAEMTGPSVPLSFALAAIVAVFTGYHYSKLGPTYPEAGGSYSYIQRAFRGEKTVSILVGYTVWFAYIAACAFYVVGFVTYASQIIPLPYYLIAFIVILPITLIHLRGVKESGFTQLLLVTTIVLILLFLVVTSVKFLNIENYKPLFPKGYHMVILAASVILVGYEGFDIIGTAEEELKNPQRDIGRAIFISIGIVSCIYISVSIVGVGVIPYDKLHGGAPLAKVASQTVGQVGELILIFGGILSTTSAFNAAILGASRVSYTLGRHQVMPKHFARVNKNSVPSVALIASLVMITILAMYGIWNPKGLALATALASAAFLVIFFLVAVSNYRLRHHTKPNLKVVYGSIVLYIIAMIALSIADPQSFRMLISWIVFVLIADFILRRTIFRWFVFKEEDIEKD
ncbi:MAG: APC family permease [Candidatus Methanofastidiosia archaeon]